MSSGSNLHGILSYALIGIYAGAIVGGLFLMTGYTGFDVIPWTSLVGGITSVVVKIFVVDNDE